MEPMDSLGLERHCFGTVAEVPGTAVAAEVPGIVVAAEGLHIAGSGLGIEAAELRTVGLAAVGYMSVAPGKRDSLDERQLQQTTLRAGCKLLAVPVVVVVELVDDPRRVGNHQHQPCIERCTVYHLDRYRNILRKRSVLLARVQFCDCSPLPGAGCHYRWRNRSDSFHHRCSRFHIAESGWGWYVVAGSLPGIHLRVGLRRLRCKTVAAVVVTAGDCIQTVLGADLLRAEPRKDIDPDCWPGQWEADIDSRVLHRIGFPVGEYLGNFHHLRCHD